MIVGFTGTRDGPLEAQHKRLQWLLGFLPLELFVHGAGGHSDALVHAFVERRFPSCRFELFPSSQHPMASYVMWPNSRTIVHPEMPPLDRNRLITQWVHGLIATPKSDTEDRSGTWTTIRYAREIGLPTYIIRGNGSIVREVKDRYNAGALPVRRRSLRTRVPATLTLLESEYV